jgi:hypothetical protein
VGFALGDGAATLAAEDAEGLNKALVVWGAATEVTRDFSFAPSSVSCPPHDAIKSALIPHVQRVCVLWSRSIVMSDPFLARVRQREPVRCDRAEETRALRGSVGHAVSCGLRA